MADQVLAHAAEVADSLDPLKYFEIEPGMRCTRTVSFGSTICGYPIRYVDGNLVHLTKLNVGHPAEHQYGARGCDGVRCVCHAAALFDDAIAKLDAATALVYAIYHCGKDNVVAMPQSVLTAYARCCDAFDPKGTRTKGVDGG